MLDTMVLTTGQDLPDPLRFLAGQPLRHADEWPARRAEIAGQLLPQVYGRLPPAPRSTQCTQLHAATMRQWPGTRLRSCRVSADGSPGFMLQLFVPSGPGRFPVVVSGDACWHHADDTVLQELLGRGYVLARFNRVEIAPDPGGPAQDLPIPEAPAQSCALAAWAWGYHRVVDVLLQLDWIDPEAVVVVGHSRGGKAALLAGATDTRIALTSANNSGAGGAGSLRWLGPGAETLDDLLGRYRHWFAPQLQAFAGRVQDLAFDQNLLKALIAPRALLTTEALDDHWANPQGSWQSHRAAQCVFDLLGVAQHLAIHFRPGGHAHLLADWQVLLDHADALRRGARLPSAPAIDPFPGLPAPARWMTAADA